MTIKIFAVIGLELAVATILLAPSAKAQQPGANITMRSNGSSVEAIVRRGAHLSAAIIGADHDLVMGAEGNGTRGHVFVGPCMRAPNPTSVPFFDNGRLGIRVVPCF